MGSCIRCTSKKKPIWREAENLRNYHIKRLRQLGYNLTTRRWLNSQAFSGEAQRLSFLITADVYHSAFDPR
jgi:hypothetical protein